MTFSNRKLGLGRMALILSAGVVLMAEESGAVSGVITASNGKPVADAVVVIKAPQLISQRTVITRADGSYRVPLLPAGDYSVSVSATGYVGASASNIRIGLGGKMTQDFTLKSIKAAETTVEVIAVAATADKTDTKTASNFSNETLDALPASDRAFFGAADLAPGVIITNTGSVALRGGTTMSTVYNLNGVSIGDDYQGQQYQSRVLDDAVEDVQVVQSPLNARFGRTGGGIINVTSKSGGNEFQGSFRAKLTRDDYSAWRPYERASGSGRADTVSQKEYDIVFSGPIIKDKLWFIVQSVQQPTVSTSSSLLAGEVPANWGAGYYLNPGDLQSSFGLPNEQFYAWDIGKTVGSGDSIDHIDIKLTYALNQDHTFTYQYFRRKEVNSNQNPYGLPIVASLESNSLAQSTLYKTNSFTYKGVLSSSTFLEASYALMKSDTSFPSPPYQHVRVISYEQQYGVIFPYGFNISPAIDARDNQSGEINLKQFVDWHGSHELDMGVQFYEFDRGTSSANGPTNSRIYANYATVDPAELAYSPASLPEGAAPFTAWRPFDAGTDPYGTTVGFLATTLAGSTGFLGFNPTYYGLGPAYRKYFGVDGQTKNRTSSIYLNDQWTINNHWNVMGGLRADRMKVFDTDGSVLMSYNTPVSPRVQIRYDLNGDNARLITVTGAKYFEDFRAGYTDAFIKKANATYANYGWSGAAIPGGWADNQIGFVNYNQLVNTGNYAGTPFSVASSAYNNFGQGSVSAPYTLEFTLGYRRNYTNGSFVSLNAVHREWKNQFDIQQQFDPSHLVTIPDFTGAGLAPAKSFGTLFTNSDLLTRRYNALEIEFSNKITAVWTFGGSLTYSRQTGNTPGGDSTSQGFRDQTPNAPTFLTTWLQGQAAGSPFAANPYSTAQFAPDGPLPQDQTFKGRLSLSARVPVGTGHVTYSWLLRYDSGVPYSAVENNKTLPGNFATANGVSSALFPSAVPIYYSGRGAFRYDDTYTVDFKLAYEVPVAAKTKLIGDIIVSNFFNHQQQAFFSTSFSATSLNQGAPITVGAAGIQANGGAGGFGTDQYNYANYIPARSVSASIGLKF